jgi:hypothetical protein
VRKLDPGQPRLCGKSYDREVAIEILLFKSTGGYTASNVVADAERLADLGLRAAQLQRLTSLPGCNCRHLVTKVGKAAMKGKPKESILELIANPVQHMLVSSFLTIVERQMTASEASQLVSKHLLAAIDAFRFHHGAYMEQLDWERLTNAAGAVVSGKLKLVTCKLCGTRHVPLNQGMGDRSCPLCRVAASITRVNSKTVTKFLPEPRKLIPSEADPIQDRRARFHAALAYSSNGPGGVDSSTTPVNSAATAQQAG